MKAEAPSMVDDESGGGSRPQRSILRDASQYMGATYATQAGLSVVGFVTKGLLGPTNVGIWSLLNILLSYLSVSQIGAGDAIAKEVPYLRQRGDDESAQRLGNAMLGFVLVTSAVVAVGVISVTLWRARTLTPVYLSGLLLVGGLFPLWMFVNMQMMACRAAKRFDVLSQQLVLQLAITVVIGLPLIWHWSIYGQYAAQVVTTGLFFVYFLRHSRRDRGTRFTPALDAAATRRLLGVGLPLQLFNFVFLFQTSADSLLAAKWLGVTALGYYALAVSVKGYVYQAPNAFAVVMFPRFQERFAASADDPAALRDYVEKPILGFAFLVLPVLIGASWEAVPYLVRHFLHAFVPAIGPIKILLVGTFFASLWHMPSQFLIAVNKLWHNVALSGVNAALVGLSVAVALRIHASVEAVAVGTSVAYTVAALITIGYALSHFRSSGAIAGFLGEVAGAGAVLFGLLVAGDVLLPAGDGVAADALRVGVRSLVLLVACAPLFWRGNRAVGVWERFQRRRARS